MLSGLTLHSDVEEAVQRFQSFITGSSNSVHEFCFDVQHIALMVVCFAERNRRTPNMSGFLGCLFYFPTIIRIHNKSAFTRISVGVVHYHLHSFREC